MRAKLSRPVFFVPLAQYIFEAVWFVACVWTPKPLNFWRVFILRLFGARVSYRAFVHPRARVTHPWHLTMHPRSCLGDRAHAYALGHITLHTGATAAQESYLCTATHNFTQPSLPLICRPIVIERQAFIGARAFILPGITVGANALVGAQSLVSRNVPAGATVAGNPAKVLRHG